MLPYNWKKNEQNKEKKPLSLSCWRFSHRISISWDHLLDFNWSEFQFLQSRVGLMRVTMEYDNILMFHWIKKWRLKCASVCVSVLMMTLFKFKMEVTLTSSMCCSTQLLIKLNEKNQYEFIGTQHRTSTNSDRLTGDWKIILSSVLIFIYGQIQFWGN